MRIIPLLFVILFPIFLQAQVHYGAWRNDHIAYQLELKGNIFQNGTKNVPGFDGTMYGQWWPTPHIELGTYTIISDTLKMYLASVDGIEAINENYGTATVRNDSLYAYFYDPTNGPFTYAELADTLFLPDDTVSAYATWPGGVPQVILFSTGRGLLRNHPTWIGVDSMGVFRQGLDSLGNEWGWIQVGTTAYTDSNPNNFVALAIRVVNNLLIATTPTELIETRIDSLNFAGWHYSGALVSVDEQPIYTDIVHQNYPNPFNPATNIRYSMSTSAHVTLTVYNMLGARVATLVDEYQSPGIHSVVFDAKKLPSGTYIYKIQVGRHAEIRKMILLK
jgi:hypothetical protein